MKPITFQQVTPADIESLSQRLSALTLRECTAAFGREAEPQEYLREAVESATDCLSARAEDGTCLAIFGYSQVDTAVACPWLLLATDIAPYKKELWYYSKQFISVLSKHFKLFNYILEENRPAMRYLSRLGFRFSPKPVFILPDQPFLYYEYIHQ